MRRLALLAWMFASLATMAAAPARAGVVLDRVRDAGVLRCGGVPKPGLAFPDAAKHWQGLEIALCRAVAGAVLGDGSRFLFHAYLQPRDFDAARDGADELVFLTAGEAISAGLPGALAPGPAVYFETAGVMVHASGPIGSLAALRDHAVCVEPGTEAERALAAGLARRSIAFHEFPFEEQVELLDAFSSGRCQAVSEETTTLGALRRDAAAVGVHVRLLPDALGPDPLMAMTPASDGTWDAAIGWIVATLIDGGARPLALGSDPVGLPAGWQSRALAGGDYAALYDATLGSRSSLGLPPGPNALPAAGGLLAAPFAQ